MSRLYLNIAFRITVIILNANKTFRQGCVHKCYVMELRDGSVKEVEELGELGLIRLLSGRFKTAKRAIVAGTGDDDCAIIDLTDVKQRYLVVTTDTVQKSTHFPDGITPFQMGWSAVAVNLSDIAAMGAHPFAFLIAMGIPEHTGVRVIDELVAGIEACAASYDLPVIGGDLTKSLELVLTGTCFGFASSVPIRRSNARVGDLVGVTGTLGNAALGLKILNGEVQVTEDIERAAKLALFQPTPRVREGILLAESGIVTSMMDISDGLALSLAELGRSSGVGFELYEDKIPVRKEVPQTLALYCGGDYELLFTVDAAADKTGIEKLCERVDMSIIGRVVPREEGIYLKKGTKREEIALKGYQHFSSTYE